MPLVTVCLITYNHEKYIRQCIDSVLAQKTNFEWDIVIAEDCSPDNTRAILLEYAQQYPQKFQLILQEKNIGGGENYLQLLHTPKGKYIAYIEGDDYWTDENKLQKQADFLEANPEYAICSHNVEVITEMDDGSFKSTGEWLGKDHKPHYTIKDLIQYGSGGASCSLFYRRTAIEGITPYLRALASGDVATQIYCTRFADMFYMPEVMGVYRLNRTGVVSKHNSITIYDDMGVKNWQRINKYFNYQYQYELDYNLYHYFYPNLMQAYWQHKQVFNYWKIRLKKKILQLKYNF